MQSFRVNGKTSNFVECLIKHPREDYYLRTWVAATIIGYENVIPYARLNVRTTDNIARYNRVVQKARVENRAPSQFKANIKVEENLGIRRDRVIDLDSAIGRQVKKVSRKPDPAEKREVRKQPDRLVKKSAEKAEGLKRKDPKSEDNDGQTKRSRK